MATPNEINSNFNQIAIADTAGNVLGVDIADVGNLKVGGGQAGYALMSTGVGSDLAFEQVQQIEPIMIPDTSWGFCRVHAYGNQIWRAGNRIGGWNVIGGYPYNSFELFFDGGGPPGIQKIALCNSDLFVLGTNGKLYGFGDGRWGEFANNSTTSNPFFTLTATPSPKLNGPGITVLNFWTNAVVTSGNPDNPSPTVYTHVNDNGTLKTYAYGSKRGTSNMTGSNTNPDPTLDPYEIPQLAGKSVVSGYVSYGTAMLITSTGEAWGIGYNYEGNLGIGTLVPPNEFTRATLTNGSPVTGAVQAGTAWQEGSGVTNYILLQNGQILSSGFGAGSRLGNGTTTGNINRFAPVQTAAGVNLQNIVKMQAFIGGVAALDNAGNVWFTGTNWDGCWGTGAAAGSTSPYASIKQTGISDFWMLGGGPYGFVSGFYLDAAANSSGHRQLWAAGQNTDYQLGAVSTSQTNILTKLPVPLPLGEYPVAMGFLGGITSSVAYLGTHLMTNNNRYYVTGDCGSIITSVNGLTALNTFHAISDFKK